MDFYTEPQLLMMDTIAEKVVRRGYDRDGRTVWLVDGARATAAQARVITSLQKKNVVKVVSESVRITGWAGPRTVSRLVIK